MIALYPGAFKPPHRGHFEVVKRLLKGNHGGHIYSIDNYQDVGTKALSGKEGKVEKINKVIVFPGGGERNGITKGEAIAIWKMYAKYLPGLEVMDGQKNPMFAAKDYAKANTDSKFYAITGVRDESDFSDLKRITTFKNTPHVEGLMITSTPDANVRASDLRKAALEGNLDDIIDFFPKELNREELFKVMRMLKDNIIAELMNKKMEDLFEAMFESEKNCGCGQTPCKTYGISEEKETQEQIPEYTKYMGSILEYMLDQKMKITPLPEIKIRHDEDNAKNFFGRTAYYDPNLKEVILFVDGRHPKDIVRSFTHEMIHHMQNLENRLGNIQTTNTTDDDHLLKIEQEAYLKGNITFRNWEDSIRSQKEQITEGRYDKLTNRISSIIFDSFKEAIVKKVDGEFDITVGPQEDADIKHKMSFDVQAVVKVTDDTYSVDGGANAGYDDDGDEIDPFINIVFQVPTNIDLKELSFDIKDVIRHEIEHLTQDGENLKQGKYIPDDGELRALIDAGLLDKDEYFKLPKEVDAMIQGMYYKAKKSKTPFVDVVDDYFEKAKVTPEERPKIKDLWNKRLPALGIKQRL